MPVIRENVSPLLMLYLQIYDACAEFEPSIRASSVCQITSCSRANVSSQHWGGAWGWNQGVWGKSVGKALGKPPVLGKLHSCEIVVVFRKEYSELSQLLARHYRLQVIEIWTHVLIAPLLHIVQNSHSLETPPFLFWCKWYRVDQVIWWWYVEKCKVLIFVHIFQSCPVFLGNIQWSVCLHNPGRNLMWITLRWQT